MTDLPEPLAEYSVRYWPVSKALPEGWFEAGSFADTHHGLYSRLIADRKEEERG